MTRCYTVARLVGLPNTNAESWVVISWPTANNAFGAFGFGNDGARIVHSADSKEKATVEARRLIVDGCQL